MRYPSKRRPTNFASTTLRFRVVRSLGTFRKRRRRQQMAVRYNIERHRIPAAGRNTVKSVGVDIKIRSDV